MREKYLVEILLIMVVLIWAGNYTVGKFGMRELPPVVFTALRFIIATPLLFLLLRMREGSLSFSRTDLPRLTVVGLVGITTYQTVFISAVKYASVTTASLALGMSPIFTALLGAATRQEKLTWSVLGGCTVAFTGMYLVIRFNPNIPDFGGSTLYGDVLSLAAGFLWGLYPILATPLLKKRSALWVTSHSALAGTLALIALAAPAALTMDWQKVTVVGWSAVLYSAIPVTVISLVAWYHGIEKIGANQVMIYMYPITPVAILIAALTIGEKLSLMQGAGAVITLLGVFWAKRAPAKPTSE